MTPSVSPPPYENFVFTHLLFQDVFFLGGGEDWPMTLIGTQYEKKMATWQNSYKNRWHFFSFGSTVYFLAEVLFNWYYQYGWVKYLKNAQNRVFRGHVSTGHAQFISSPRFLDYKQETGVRDPAGALSVIKQKKKTI